MKSAAPMATGTANTSATTAISTVSTITAPMPNCWPSGFHLVSVKKPQPPSFNAGQASRRRNVPIAARMTNVVTPAPIATAR